MKSEGLLGGLYKPLSDENIEKIHEASLYILENVGFTYEPDFEDISAKLQKAGAKVDFAKRRIKTPKYLVTEQINRSPEEIKLYSREDNHFLNLCGNKVYLGTGGAAITILDLNTGKPRDTTLNDIYQIGRLVDHLENIHFFIRPCIPKDIEEKFHDINIFYACLKATKKHVMAGVNNVKGLRDVLKLCAIVAGSLEKLQEKPFISFSAGFCISPLKLCTQSMSIIQEAIINRIPVALSSAPMAGSTSPITMAGTLAQLHAEQMFGITICQLIQPGAAVIYGGIPGMANLRTMGYLGGAVECGMMNAAIHQLANHIKVPNYNSSGISDSKLPDIQAGWEKASNVLLAAMGGSNYCHHAAGMLDSLLSIAYEQYIIDDEIIGMACKVLKGIDVNDENLAIEEIEKIGPGGNFMMSPHTLRHMRNEYFSGNGVTDSRIRAQWEQDSSLDARERAKEIARKILNTKENPYITPEMDKMIRARFPIVM